MTRTLAGCMTGLAAALILALVPTGDALSQESGDEAYDELVPVVVVGQFTPALWKVSRGDHHLWILGSLGLQPTTVRWTSSRLEALIAGSKELLLPGSSLVYSSGNTFLSAVIGSQENPSGRKLKDLMPPEAHARWLVLRDTYGAAGNGVATTTPAFAWDKNAKWVSQTRRYTGGDGIENLRPVFAWEGLRRAALDRSALASYDVEAIVGNIAKQHAVPVRKLPSVREGIPGRDHNPILETAAVADYGDAECLVANLDRFETDLAELKLRANAWARGDLQSLLATPRSMPVRDCIRELTGAVSGGELPGTRGGKAAQEDARVARLESNRKAEAAWMKAAQAAIKKNAVTFAVLPLDRLLAEDGYAVKLRKLGYEVQDPS